AADVLAAGRQVLILLPEIALTSRFLDRFRDRFGVRPAAWHSHMSAGARERVWHGVRSGAARAVIGARSALFLPFAELGLVVIDEEHEGAYKQDDGVPYHGRDIGVVRGLLGKIPVLLSSATPSVESLVNAESGKYAHVRLNHRHGGAVLPKVGLVDMRRSPPERGRFLSPVLIDALRETFARGEQALLFLNRRGYAPLTLCRACGHRISCPHCDAWLVEHRRAHKLMCHHCGYETRPVRTCPSCGAADAMVACGPGIERIAEEAAALFPDQSMTVLSSDLSGDLTRVQRVFADIEAGRIDLVIGTQLVAKGHHFPGLTLVGVVDADLGLAMGDLRAAERSYQLVHQVAGRAGRADLPGKVILQTHTPEHPVLQALAADDRDMFYEREIAQRRDLGLPPFGRLAAVIVSGKVEAELIRFCRKLAAAAPAAAEIRVLGPAPAPLFQIRGRYRMRFLLKAAPGQSPQAYLKAWLGPVKAKAGIRLRIDIDPQNFL
ncbi:MAG: primosomal protein N', partial [Hyphomicrobiales bacterium]